MKGGSGQDRTGQGLPGLLSPPWGSPSRARPPFCLPHRQGAPPFCLSTRGRRTPPYAHARGGPAGLAQAQRACAPPLQPGQRRQGQDGGVLPVPGGRAGPGAPPSQRGCPRPEGGCGGRERGWEARHGPARPGGAVGARGAARLQAWEGHGDAAGGGG